MNRRAFLASLAIFPVLRKLGVSEKPTRISDKTGPTHPYSFHAFVNETEPVYQGRFERFRGGWLYTRDSVAWSDVELDLN